MSGIPRTKRIIFSLVFLIICSLLPFSSIRAEESTHSDVSHSVQTSVNDVNHDATHNGDRSGDLIDLFYRFINFTLLVIILFVVIKKTKIMDHLSTRGEEIKQRLSDLKREKEEAESKYRELETKLRDFETKRKGLLDQYRKEGLAEKDKIISEAKERVKQILEQSELTIQQEMAEIYPPWRGNPLALKPREYQKGYKMTGIHI